MQIRLAQPKDQDALMQLFHKLSQHYTDNPKALSIIWSRLKDTSIFIGEFEGQVFGTATLSIRGVPSAGLVGHIDDVVTSEDFRGRGYGYALIKHCVEEAREKGCIRVELTSHPLRIMANQLYLKMGFEPRETNNYVLKL